MSRLGCILVHILFLCATSERPAIKRADNTWSLQPSGAFYATQNRTSPPAATFMANKDNEKGLGYVHLLDWAQPEAEAFQHAEFNIFLLYQNGNSLGSDSRYRHLDSARAFQFKLAFTDKANAGTVIKRFNDNYRRTDKHYRLSLRAMAFGGTQAGLDSGSGRIDMFANRFEGDPLGQDIQCTVGLYYRDANYNFDGPREARPSIVDSLGKDCFVPMTSMMRHWHRASKSG